MHPLSNANKNTCSNSCHKLSLNVVSVAVWLKDPTLMTYTCGGIVRANHLQTQASLADARKLKSQRSAYRYKWQRSTHHSFLQPLVSLMLGMLEDEGQNKGQLIRY